MVCLLLSFFVTYLSLPFRSFACAGTRLINSGLGNSTRGVLQVLRTRWRSSSRSSIITISVCPFLLYHLTRLLISSITPAPLLLAYHFFSVALYSIYILFTSGVPPLPGQEAHVPRIYEYPYTCYLAFRVVSSFLQFFPLLPHSLFRRS